MSKAQSSNALSAAPFFSQRTDGAFVGNDPARGPWSPDHCHAGPVTGLVARAAEQAVGPGKMLTRLTLDILRPLPLAGLWVAAETTRHTRTLATTSVTVQDDDGTLCVRASSMHLVEKDLGQVPTAPVTPLRLEEATPGDFTIGAGLLTPAVWYSLWAFWQWRGHKLKELAPTWAYDLPRDDEEAA